LTTTNAQNTVTEKGLKHRLSNSFKVGEFVSAVSELRRLCGTDMRLV